MEFTVSINFIADGKEVIKEKQVVADNIIEAISKAKSEAIKTFITKRHVTEIKICEIGTSC